MNGERRKGEVFIGLGPNLALPLGVEGLLMASIPSDYGGSLGDECLCDQQHVTVDMTVTQSQENALLSRLAGMSQSLSVVLTDPLKTWTTPDKYIFLHVPTTRYYWVLYFA